ncbi:MAG: hypothetical protein FD123_631 [Bacteroidetes bacterium]|nr:MAG: hypothetical protein FD123_631 [Bacteroidota bacterium]
MLNKIRRKKISRVVACLLALSLLTDYIFPVVAFALTSGPSQEEYASFEPASTSDMVDLYTGDFNYNIPVLVVPGPNGGYPINLAYHSGATMDQEASWVGLGWNINVGSVNRQIRGLPDDFKGDGTSDRVRQTAHMKNNWTVGLNIPNFAEKEVFGFPVPTNSGPTLLWQVRYNNYKGLGYRVMLNPDRAAKHLELPVGVGLSYDSQNGIGLEPYVNLRATFKKAKFSLGVYASASISNREGLEGVGFSSSFGIMHDAGKKLDKALKNINGRKPSNAPDRVEQRSSMSFLSTQPVPSVGIPMKNHVVDMDIRFGTAPVFGQFKSEWPKLWQGYWSQSETDNNGIVEENAYGYLHLSNLYQDEKGYRDFNRENFQYSKKIPNLAPSAVTHDLYMQTGQGSGSVFRPYRMDIGVIGDPSRVSKSRTDRLNVEFGNTGTNYHAGLGYTLGRGKDMSGLWQDVGNNPDNQTNLTLSEDYNSEPDYQPCVFLPYGEKSGVKENDDLLKYWGGDQQAVRIKLDKDEDNNWNKRQFVATDEFIESEISSTPAVATVTSRQQFKQRRHAHATNIETFTNELSQKQNFLGYVKNISYYDDDPQSSTYHQSTWPVKSFSHSGSHLSAMNVVEKDGMRYNYALPVYNKKQKDVLFITGNGSQSQPANHNTALIDVPNNGTDVDVDGLYSEFLSQNEVPEYVNNWLLTSVVSSEYVDLTNDGPSDDDYGYWVKFEYRKCDDNYRWRVPYQKARFIEGHKNDPSDDLGTYTYGEKELYYLYRVVTKTHIAVFETSERQDGRDANGEFASSGIGSGKMQKLDKIKLYAKEAYLANPTTTVPIRTVNFRYSYTLCPNVANNTQAPVNVFNQTVSSGSPDNINDNFGKLTLDTLFFTSLTSGRGELSPYVFTYSNNNPGYNIQDIDRWGNYKANSTNYSGSSNKYPYADFGYTEQNAAPVADAWALTKIYLPSGGEVEIEYESDDYGFVEDKPATRMFDIQGIGGAGSPNSWSYGGYNSSSQRNASGTNWAHLESHVYGDQDNYRIYFDLETPLSTSMTQSAANDYVKNNYVRGLTQVYFRTTSELMNTLHPNAVDYVSGYAELATPDVGQYNDFIGAEKATSNAPYTRGYITLKKEPLSELNILVNQSFNPSGLSVNPLLRASLQHLKVERPELLYNAIPYANSAAAQMANFVGSLPQVMNDLVSSFTGYTLWSYIKQYSRHIRLDGLSIMRLCDPDSKKYGGGSRVKKITAKDNWINTSTADAATYGTTYSYVMEDGSSSGVAYEPSIGFEECALAEPNEYELSTFLTYTQHLFVEKPLLKSYYPGPLVGYRRVVTKSIAPQQANSEDSQNNLVYSAAPINVFEFYSPKDFPVYTDETDMNADRGIFRLIPIPGVYSSISMRKARSQGYLVELNDMPGKLKSVASYTRRQTASQEIGSLVSKSEFIYETMAAYDPDQPNRLSSKVQVMTDDGHYVTGVIGQTEDVFVDMNEDRVTEKSRGLDLNLEIKTTPVPIIIPIPLPYMGDLDMSMRTAVTNKIIYKTGILRKVVQTEDQSVVETENLAYDLETGEAILSKTTNEFKDPVFSYVYPAHWYYKGMGGAYRNWDVVVDRKLASSTLSAIVPNSSGRLQLTSYLPSGKKTSDYFTEGDDVWVDFTSATDKIYTVVKVGENTTTSTSFIDMVDLNGDHVPAQSIESIRVIRSGYRNLQGLNVGSLESKEMDNFTAYDPADSQTLVSSASGNSETYTPDHVINAFATTYTDVWQTECFECEGHVTSVVNPYWVGLRGLWRPNKDYVFNTSRTQNDNIRYDGEYNTFDRFRWENLPANVDEWTRSVTITKYSPYGHELESRDAESNYQSALYEYNNALNTVVAGNAKHREIGYDGFEDYDMMDACSPSTDHWGVYPSRSKISAAEHHTGKHSIEVKETESVTISSLVSASDCEETLDGKQTTVISDTTATEEYEVEDCDCIGQLSLIPGKKYVLGSWVKQVGSPPLGPLTTYYSPYMQVEFRDASAVLISSATVNIIPTTDNPIIEGWQRLYGSFTVPSNAASVTVKLINGSGGTGTSDFFDDIRIHPFEGSMLCSVYDPVSLRLMATLDENNYALFYGYDNEGNLTVAKKETVKGIRAVQDSRTTIKPQ